MTYKNENVFKPDKNNLHYQSNAINKFCKKEST